MFQPFTHPHSGIGSHVTVSIDYKNQLIKREFPEQSRLCNGTVRQFKDDEQKSLYDNETYWLKRLETTIPLPELVEVNDEERCIIQRYCGPDLLIQSQSDGWTWNDGLTGQLIDIYKALYDLGVCKRNGSLSNMCLGPNGELQVFDFKWAFCAFESPEVSLNPNAGGPLGIDDERYSAEHYLAKISGSVSTRISQLFCERITDRLGY